MADVNARLGWALELGGRGWPVFPLLPHSKRPALHGDTPARPCPRTGPCAEGHVGWERLATTDPRLIEADWSHPPDRNIGIACGPAGLVVLDLDQPKPDTGHARSGAQSLIDLARAHQESIPRTWTVATPSDGRHYYYTAPPGARLRCTRWRRELIDIRAWGGYVVAPDSTLPRGGYELLDDRDPAPLPDWLHGLLTPPPRQLLLPTQQCGDDPAGRDGRDGRGRGVDAAGGEAELMAAITHELDWVRHAPRGAHNSTLNIAAFKLGLLAGAGRVDTGYLADQLYQAAEPRIGMPCDCDDTEIRRVIDAGLRAGTQRHTHPRTSGPGQTRRPPS